MLQSEDAAVGQVIGARSINNLPLNGRNFTFLAQLSAGVTYDQEDTRGLGASGSFAANGLRPAQNNYLLDGIDNNVNLVDFLNGTAFVVKPPVDAIAEFKIQTNNYSAEAGRSAGAILNATIKSGTNEFHGNAWEFLRNDALDAANFFENSGGIARRGVSPESIRLHRRGSHPQEQNVFLWGLRRHANPPGNAFDKHGSHGTGARQRLHQSVGVCSPRAARAPTCWDARQLWARSLIRPRRARCLAGCPTPSRASRRPARAACPPAARSDSFASLSRETSFPPAGSIRMPSNCSTFIRSPNNSGLFNNYCDQPCPCKNQPISSMFGWTRISVRRTVYLAARAMSITLNSFPGPFRGIADGGSFAQGIQTAISDNDALSETHSFSPSLVNEARLGFNRIATTRLRQPPIPLGIPAQFGIQGVPQVPPTAA